MTVTSPSATGPGAYAGGADQAAGQFPDFEILEVVGGGMGVVYKARQVSLNRVVALKTIRSGTGASEAEVRRFRTEAEAAARLDHPGIVPVYQTGESRGQHFIVMAFVEGVTLAGRTAAGPLPPRDAAELTRQAAEAVQYAHERGVVHRDLKPGNVMVGTNGRARVADFGLAKHVEADSSLTETGQVLGTPSYMPPEQAAGRHDEVGPPSDVYALGATLYHLLTGRPPFRGATVHETLRQVIEADPVPPRRLNPAVPPDLETVCLRCLAKEPARRYASAGEVAGDLARWLAGDPVRARQSDPWERTARRLAKWPAALLVPGLLALLLRDVPLALFLAAAVGLAVLLAAGALLRLAWSSVAEYDRRLGSRWAWALEAVQGLTLLLFAFGLGVMTLAAGEPSPERPGAALLLAAAAGLRLVIGFPLGVLVGAVGDRLGRRGGDPTVVRVSAAVGAAAALVLWRLLSEWAAQVEGGTPRAAPEPAEATAWLRGLSAQPTLALSALYFHAALMAAGALVGALWGRVSVAGLARPFLVGAVLAGLGLGLPLALKLDTTAMQPTLQAWGVSQGPLTLAGVGLSALLGGFALGVPVGLLDRWLQSRPRVQRSELRRAANKGAANGAGLAAVLGSMAPPV